MVEVSSVAGIVAGRNPLEYSASSPYTIFLFQSVFITLFCNLLHIPIKRLQQPKVISEVVTGILLGPSVMGHIPGFTDNCFPAASIPGLTLFANVGIILFLFIVGMEVDLQFIKKNMKVALTVGLINMAIPFGLGCAISVGIYNHYRILDGEDGSMKFTTYMVFIAVAMCITAFPVLARILTELNLISDRVGTIVLAAGITNDLTGWILLALTVTLANAANPISVVYILLLTVGWFLFLYYPARYALTWYLRKFTNDLTSGEPAQFSMVIIIVMVFVSAFYTDIIGVHPIFGAFMIGVIVPRENGYVIRITEKLEDVVHIVLIPIYFAIAGLNVNLGLLNTGTDWGYTIGIIMLAMIGKIFGGFVASRICGLFWVESLAVGVLMSCKGIVEIVVLNVGLNANIISQRVYSMFIVMALITTFLTTPLAKLVYPVSYREKRAKEAAELSNSSSDEAKESEDLITSKFRHVNINNVGNVKVPRISVVLRDTESLESLLPFLQSYFHGSKDSEVRGLYLKEFGSRTSHLLEASNAELNNSEEMQKSNAVLSLFKIFSGLMNIPYTTQTLFSLPKNQLLTLNDQIRSESELLLTADKLRDVIESPLSDSVESDHGVLYKQLFSETKCNFALLLKRNETGTLLPTMFEDDSTLADFGSSISLVINNDNSLTPSDLLAIYLTHQFSSTVKQVNIIIRETSNSTGLSGEIEAVFNEAENVSVAKVKASGSIKDELSRHNSKLKHSLFVVANNISGSDNLFTSEVIDLAQVCLVEGCDLLVVKCPVA